MVSAQISTCLFDISAWMKECHLRLNLSKTELLVISANWSFHHNINIKCSPAFLTSTKVTRNLIDNQSCCSALSNVRKIRPGLTQCTTQYSIWAMIISCFDYCSSALAGHPHRYSRIWLCLVFNQPKNSQFYCSFPPLANRGFQNQIQVTCPKSYSWIYSSTCVFAMVEQATRWYQSWGIPLYFQQSPEDPSIPRGLPLYLASYVA